MVALGGFHFHPPIAKYKLGIHGVGGLGKIMDISSPRGLGPRIAFIAHTCAAQCPAGSVEIEAERGHRVFLA